MIKIAWLFPDTFYLNGDRGNLLALEKFLKLSGKEYSVDKIDFDTENFSPMDYDLIFCPPGEVTFFEQVADWLRPFTDELRRFVDSGKVLFVTGTSVAMWCEKIQRSDGSLLEGLGLLRVTAKERTQVYGDDLCCTCKIRGEEMDIIGMQIQLVDYEPSKEKPFGTLKYGFGNSGKDKKEGFALKNSIFTNALGPVLACNPWLAVAMINLICEERGEEVIHDEPDFSLERKSYEIKRDFIRRKETKLTNCDRSTL